MVSSLPSIILVDDEPDILVALTDMLEESFQVLSTTDPMQALDILQKNPEISVIVSDQRMPVMTGDQFLAKARDITTAPAILLTGYADMNAVIAALNQGRIMFYSHKPWESESLRSMVMQASEKFRLEQELSIERALFQGMMENSHEGLAFKDEQGRFLRINQLAAHYFDRQVTECLGKREEDLLNESNGSKVAQAYARLEKEGRTEETVQERDPVTGQVVRWLHISRVLLTSIASHRFSLLIGRDITEHKKMEARLRQAEKMQALGTMAGGIAHDFNNILAAILGSLELIGTLGAVTDKKIQKLLENASKAAQKGNGLTQRLLAFSRNKELALKDVDVRQMLDDLVPIIQCALEKRNHSKGLAKEYITFDKPDLSYPLPFIRTDKDQLEMAIMNLCFNAADAMEKAGHISVSLKEVKVEKPNDMDIDNGRYVCLSVMDTGIGMSEETLTRVFEPFFTTKGIGHGTGLGLPMVYGFMQQQHGGIRIQSKPGCGTTVELYLPIAEEPEGLQSKLQVLPDHIPLLSVGLKVLVIDDDESVVAVIKGFLETLGHRVVLCVDGQHATQLLEKDSEFDLLLIDLSMPNVNGIECAEHVKKFYPHIRIIYITAYMDRSVFAVDGPVLYKPFTQADLSKQLRRIF